MKKYLRGLDAKTVAATALLLIVLLSFWQLLHQQNDLAEKDRRIDALIGSAQTKDDAAVMERRAASRERRAIAANQRALLAYTRSLAQRQGALLAYLHEHGIEIPPRFTVPVNAPVLRDPTPSTGTPGQPSGDHQGNNDDGHQGGNGNNQPGDSPGNSGNAPGHNKPPKPPHGHHGGNGHGPKALDLPLVGEVPIPDVPELPPLDLTTFAR